MPESFLLNSITMKRLPVTFYCLLLILGFAATVANATNGSFFTCLLGSYQSRQPIERVYVHQDRTEYYAGETIWLKVYRTISSQAEAASGIVYIDLVSGEGKFIAQVKYPLTEGQASGSLQIPLDDVPAGHYQLRAYTRWMQNFDPNGFFHREIIIHGPSSQQAGKAEDSKISNCTLEFFPEGGYLVEGLPSKVAFEIRGIDEKDFPLEGVIYNEQGDSIQRFFTTLREKGRFYFQPRKGERYTARLKGSSKEFNLPAAQPEGFVCTVKRVEDILRIQLAQNLSPVNKENHRFMLVFHQEDGCFMQLPVDSSKEYSYFNIPLGKLPNGIFTLTLTDETYRVFCEQLVFARFPETLSLSLQPSFSQQKGCRLMSLDIIACTDEGIPQQGSFSLAVVSPLLEKTTLRDNFKSYFHLSSELKGSLKYPSDYWNPDDPESLSRIELLLLTQGWRRYSFEALCTPDYNPTFPMEQSLTLSGKIKDVFRKKNSSLSVNAVIRQDSLQQFMVCPVDNGKRFHFSGMSFYGQTHVLLSASNEKGKTFPITLDNPLPTPEVNYRPSPFVQDSTSYVKWKAAHPFLAKPGIDKQTFNLGEVTVTARKRDKMENRRTYYGEDFVRASVEVKEANSFGDLRNLLRSIPFVVMVNNPDPGKAYYTYAHITGTPKGSTATFVLDGFLLKDSEMAYSLDASQIERVEVLRQTITSFGGFVENNGGGIIALYSRHPGEGLPTVDNKLICEWMGYSQAKEFYVPALTDTAFFKKKELRNTLYWNPAIRTDANGKASVSFYLNDSENGKYTVHCEGFSIEGLIGAESKVVELDAP